MIKKTITYTDYNGVDRTDDFYFNISKAEATDLNYSRQGGLENWVRAVIDSHNDVELWKLFKYIISISYGVKSADGRQFKKSEELSEAFMQSEAYSVLLEEIMSNGEAASAFFNGLIAGVNASQDKPVLTVV